MPLPSDLALTTIADGSSLVAAPVRDNFTDIQTAVNDLIGDFEDGGAAGEILTWDATFPGKWVASAASSVAPSVESIYAPAWTSTGTAPVLGNGTLAGSYVQWGPMVVAQVKLVVGSTTTFGSGFYSVSVPVATTLTDQYGAGSCWLSGGNSPQMLRWRSDGTIYLNQLAVSLISPTSPITFASGSELDLNIAYLVA